MSCGITGRLNNVPVVLISAFLAVVPSLAAKELLTLVLIKTIVEPVRAAAVGCCCSCWWCNGVTLLRWCRSGITTIRPSIGVEAVFDGYSLLNLALLDSLIVSPERSPCVGGT
uniref:Putative secreted peptide n=1 Tax=Anopheles braziliensis TaxID=58242 RepID=A0A2M3ZT58_9DIPT